MYHLVRGARGGGGWCWDLPFFVYNVVRSPSIIVTIVSIILSVIFTDIRTDVWIIGVLYLVFCIVC